MNLYVGEYFSKHKNRLLRRVWQLKIHLQHFVLFLSCSIFTILIFIQVVSRYIFNHTFFGLEEAAAYLAVVMYFIGSASGAQMKNHISASLIDSLISPGLTVDLVHIITRIISVFISMYVSIKIWDLMEFAMMMNTRSMELRISMVWIYACMFIGTSLMSFYLLVEMLEDSISCYKSYKAKTNQFKL